MLIKLESGDYVDTYYIERLWMVNERDGYIRFANNRFANNPDVQITKNDYGLIVKAMEPNYLEEYDAVLPDDMPVIPEAVGVSIKEQKAKQSLGGALFDAIFAANELGRKKVGPVVNWMVDNDEMYATAWVLDTWRVEETGEIVKLEAEK